MLLDLKRGHIHLGSAADGKIYSGEHNTLGSTKDGFYLSHDGLSIGSAIRINATDGGSVLVGNLKSGNKYWTINGDTSKASITYGTRGNADSVSLRTDELTIGSKFYVSASDGSMRLGNGAVTNTGKHWSISTNGNESYIAYNTTSFDGSSGVYIGTDGIRLNSKFSVDKDGAILSKSGLIGGWVIGSDSISSDNIELKAKGSIKHTGGKWEIKQNGDAEFQSLTANTGGSIGGWEIKSWGLSKNNIEIRSDGSIKNGDNWYINSSGNAKFNNITCQSTWSFGTGKNTWSSASGFSFSLGSLGSNIVNDKGLGFTKGTVGLGTASKGNNGISWNGTKCIIAGDIYANNGYFEGEIKATSGSFKGEIEANKFSFDDGNGHTMSMGYSSDHPSVSGLNIGSGGIKVGDNSGQGLSDIQFVSSITDVSVTVNTGLTNTKVSVGVSYNVRKFTFSSGVCTGLTSSEGKIESGSGQG